LLLRDDPALRGEFETVVNFENLAHLLHPARIVTGMATLLRQGATLITSTPNGEISDGD
jgi:2-polyprenyl-3-methyl-5-hydroxy-6-metoxy-1,4-benzoquinol methylase